MVNESEKKKRSASSMNWDVCDIYIYTINICANSTKYTFHKSMYTWNVCRRESKVF